MRIVAKKNEILRVVSLSSTEFNDAAKEERLDTRRFRRNRLLTLLMASGIIRTFDNDEEESDFK